MMRIKYDYIITTFMSKKTYVMFLEKFATQMGGKLIYHNSKHFTPKLFDLFLYFKYFKINDLKKLFFAAKQRQIRRSKNGKVSNIISTLYFLRGLYQSIGMFSFSKDKNVLFFPNEEPYVEAYSIRLAAKALPQKTSIIYQSESFVAIQEDRLDLAPALCDFKSLKKLLKNCINDKLKKNINKNILPEKVYMGSKKIGNLNLYEKNYKLNKDINLDGHAIIFMHDFFDAPGVYGKGLFDSLVDWFEFTIDVIKKNEIKFYLKSHPNQLIESKNLMHKLIKKYELEHYLIDNLSSKQIYDSNPKYIISNHGSVLLEALQHQIPLAFSGESLVSLLGIISKPKSKLEYAQMILSPKKPKLDKEVLVSFVNQMKNYEFPLKYSIPLSHSDHEFFLKKNPVNTRHLREICENSAFYHELFEESLNNMEFKNLCKDIMLNNFKN